MKCSIFRWTCNKSNKCECRSCLENDQMKIEYTATKMFDENDL